MLNYKIACLHILSVQFSSITQSCPTLCDPIDCSTPGFPVHHELPELAHSCPLSWWCHPTISSCRSPLLLPSILPSVRVFCNESALRIRWPKYWSFSFNFSPSNECSGLISFRVDWFDRLSDQWTLKSLLQSHSSKASKQSYLNWLLVVISATRESFNLLSWPEFLIIVRFNFTLYYHTIIFFYSLFYRD